MAGFSSRTFDSVNIGELMRRMDETSSEGLSEHSQRALETDMRYWAGYLETRFRGADRLGFEVIITFIKDHYDGLPKRVDGKLVRLGLKKELGTQKLTTINRKLTSLSRACKLLGLANPLSHPKVKVFREELKRRSLGEGKRPKGKKPITLEVLDAVLGTCDLDCMKGRRDHALLLVAWASGGRRRSELARATLDELTLLPDGFALTLPPSRRSVFDESLTVPIKGRAAESLRAYLEAAQLTDGPIFRSVLRSGELQDKGISAQMVNLILKERLRQAGYDAREYGAHSLRAGFLMEGGKQRMALSDLMAMSGHRTASHAIRYHRAGAAMDNPAALMAG